MAQSLHHSHQPTHISESAITFFFAFFSHRRTSISPVLATMSGGCIAAHTWDEVKTSRLLHRIATEPTQTWQPNIKCTRKIAINQMENCAAKLRFDRLPTNYVSSRWRFADLPWYFFSASAVSAQCTHTSIIDGAAVRKTAFCKNCVPAFRMDLDVSIETRCGRAIFNSISMWVRKTIALDKIIIIIIMENKIN